MADNYFILKAEVTSHYCIIKNHPEGVKRSPRLTAGVPLKGSYPDNAIFYMDEDHTGMKLADFIANHLRYLIVSDKVKAILEKEAITNIEYLPVSIYDQKKRCASSDYYIANILGSIDCLDHEKSEYDRSLIVPEKIQAFYKVALLEEKIPEDEKLFRLKDQPSIIIIRKDLLALLKGNDLTGIDIFNLNEHVML